MFEGLGKVDKNVEAQKSEEWGKEAAACRENRQQWREVLESRCRVVCPLLILGRLCA